MLMAFSYTTTASGFTVSARLGEIVFLVVPVTFFSVCKTLFLVDEKNHCYDIYHHDILIWEALAMNAVMSGSGPLGPCFCC